jgi:translocation and assembly module TamA
MRVSRHGAASPEEKDDVTAGMGNAFASSYPDFKEPIRFAAGLGLRYYTAIGPIRLDLAMPLERTRGATQVAVYVSIGQAF